MTDAIADHDRHGPGRIKVVDVPRLGAIEFHMRYRDRRAGRGHAIIEPRDGVFGGYGVMRGYGSRRTIVVVWQDGDGEFHTWVRGPVPTLRGRSSPRYGARGETGWVSV